MTLLLPLFQDKMAALLSCLPLRDGSDPETTHRNRTYYTHLRDLDPDDFIEACDRILFTDEWMPTIARIRAVADECRRERIRHAAVHAVVPELVCATCRGARLVRMGGYDPPHVKAGEDGSRTVWCPRCTTDGHYDADKEQANIAIEGGVYNPNATHEPDMSMVTWPARMAAMRDPVTGKLDFDELYRLSRELRGLDPNVDERQRAAVPGWKSFGQLAEREVVGVP